MSETRNVEHCESPKTQQRKVYTRDQLCAIMELMSKIKDDNLVKFLHIRNMVVQNA